MWCGGRVWRAGLEGWLGVGVPSLSLNIAMQGHPLPQTSERAKMTLYGTAPRLCVVVVVIEVHFCHQALPYPSPALRHRLACGRRLEAVWWVRCGAGVSLVPAALFYLARCAPLPSATQPNPTHGSAPPRYH